MAGGGVWPFLPQTGAPAGQQSTFVAPWLQQPQVGWTGPPGGAADSTTQAILALAESQKATAELMAESQNRVAMAVAMGTQQQQRRSEAEAREKTEKGKMDDDVLANVEAWSGAEDGSMISPVYKEGGFSAKRTDEGKRQLAMGGMVAWAEDNGKEIDTTIRFDKNQIGDMARGDALPFGHEPDPANWCRGTNIEACRSLTQGEKAADIEYESLAETLGDHVIVWKKGDPPLPAKDYNEMRLVVATYCALLFVLYTANCPLYIAMVGLLEVLEDPRVQVNRHRFTRHFCAKLTYAIIFETNQFFLIKVSRRTLDLKGRAAFPQSTLATIYDKVRLQANLDDFPGFPECWMPGRRSPGQRTRQLLGPQGVLQPWAPGEAQRPWPGRTHTPPPGPYAARGRSPSPVRQVTWGPALPAAPAPATRRPDAALSSASPYADWRTELGHLHPVVARGMQAFHEKFKGKVFWSQMKEKADKAKLLQIRAVSDSDGRCTLCFNRLLGICPFGDRCERVESHNVQLTNKQANALMEAVRPGVDHLLAEGPRAFAPRHAASKRPRSQ